MSNKYIEIDMKLFITFLVHTYIMLVPTDESKGTLKRYEELWCGIKYFIRSITNNSDDCDEKYMKIKIISDDNLPLKKTLELRNMAIVVRSVLHEGNRYYLHVF